VTTIDYLITISMCLAPVFELRGGLPFALSQGMQPAGAFFLCIAANLLVVPILLYGLSWGERIARRWGPMNRLLDAVLTRTLRKGKWVDRLGSIGLLLLVAIPLPGTGAWTGSLVAVALGIPKRRALLLITLGVLIAGTLVLLAGLSVIHLFGGEAGTP